MPVNLPPPEDLTPSPPPVLIPGGGVSSPGTPPVLVTPVTPPPVEAPPVNVPVTPQPPSQPEAYIRKMVQVSSAGASHAFALAHGGNYIRRTHTGAMQDSLPTNASVAYPLMTVLTFRNATAAQDLSVIGGGGVTLNGVMEIPPGGSGQAIKVGPNEWDAV